MILSLQAISNQILSSMNKVQFMFRIPQSSIIFFFRVITELTMAYLTEWVFIIYKTLMKWNEC